MRTSIWKFWSFLPGDISAIPLNPQLDAIERETSLTKRAWQRKRPIQKGIALCLFCLPLALAGNAQEAADQAHTPSVKQHSAQDRSSALSDAQSKAFASLEPIDTHTHIFRNAPDFTAMLQRLHMHVLDILVVDDTEPYGKSIEPQRHDALTAIASSAGHESFCTTFDPYQINKSDFQEKAIASLNQDFSEGAIAVKIWKNLGMEVKDASGKYVLPDDPRLEPIYKDIAAHHKTMIAHVAEPDEAWNLPTSSGLDSSYYRGHSQWDMSKKPLAPSKQQILLARDHILQMNPDLRVVGAHLGSMEDNLDAIAARFEKYPNFAVDTAARVVHLVIQPRDKVRAFMIKYQDRILYGTDLEFLPGATASHVVTEWNEQYARDWRYFATDETFEYRGHRVQGLNLPPSVLKKLYHDNAVHWFPGINR